MRPDALVGPGSSFQNKKNVFFPKPSEVLESARVSSAASSGEKRARFLREREDAHPRFHTLCFMWRGRDARVWLGGVAAEGLDKPLRVAPSLPPQKNDVRSSLGTTVRVQSDLDPSRYSTNRNVSCDYFQHTLRYLTLERASYTQVSHPLHQTKRRIVRRSL